MKQLGEYVELKLLGRGGWTGVYRGRHRGNGREYALKVFGPLERGRREALARKVNRAALEHPQVLKVYGLESDQASGCCFLAMEYAPLGSLRQRLAAGPLEADLALELALQAARGLQAAHRKGLCHLDLKPENVLLTGSGQVKLGDLGLAACREEPSLDEMAQGGAGYLAPEQLAGSPGPASDVYALGALLCEMLTGRPPAPQTSGEDAARPIDTRALLAGAGLEGSADLASLLERLLAPLPEDRPSNGGQAAALLELLLAGRGPAAFNRTLELANRCRVCQKPIPLSRSLCPICAGRAHAGEAAPAAPPPEAGSGRGGSKLRSAGLGFMMLLLLGAGLCSWQGGAAWRVAGPLPAAEAPARDMRASLPKGVAILKAASQTEAPSAAEKAGPETPGVATASARGKEPGAPGEKAGGLGNQVKEALYTAVAPAGSLEKAVRSELVRRPQSLGARRNLALLLMQKGDYEKAAGLLRGILRGKARRPGGQEHPGDDSHPERTGLAGCRKAPRRIRRRPEPPGGIHCPRARRVRTKLLILLVPLGLLRGISSGTGSALGEPLVQFFQERLHAFFADVDGVALAVVALGLLVAPERGLGRAEFLGFAV